MGGLACDVDRLPESFLFFSCGQYVAHPQWTLCQEIIQYQWYTVMGAA